MGREQRGQRDTWLEGAGPQRCVGTVGAGACQLDGGPDLAGMGEVTERVEAALRGLIESGERSKGDKMPSERQIVETYGAGRTTVRLVLAKLAAQGLIEPRHGRGYFVCAPRSEAAADS